MNAVLAGAKIHGTSAKRIAGAARYEPGQIGLARDHFRGRIPIRPFCLPADGLHAGPGEAFAADANAITNGPALAKDVIERGVAGIDDDSAGRFAGVKGNDRAP